MPQSEIKRAVDKCYRWLAYRARTEYELRRKLESAGFSSAVVDMALTGMKEKKLLDDQIFAVNWVRRRLSAKPVGAGRLWAELRQKGVDGEIIAVALDGYDEESELEAAMRLARKKFAGSGGGSDLRRLAGFLIRRGFSGSVVAKVCRRIAEDDRFDIS